MSPGIIPICMCELESLDMTFFLEWSGTGDGNKNENIYAE